MFKISCFADEISLDINEQITLLNKLNIKNIALRSVNNINVMDLTNEMLRDIKENLDKNGIAVASIGSPIGKTQIEDKDIHITQMNRAVEICKIMNCTIIRMFSFYVKKEEKELYKSEILRRLSEMIEIAKNNNIILYHENEAGIYGEQSVECEFLIKNLHCDNFKLAFDPSNFVIANEKPFDESFEKLSPYICELHIKDSKFKGDITLAGEGDGQIFEIFVALKDRDILVTLEPHLAEVGVFRGFSGTAMFEKAFCSLKNLLDQKQIIYK